MSELRQIRSVNPATEEVLATFEPHSRKHVDAAVGRAVEVQRDWAQRPFFERAAHMRRAAALLRESRAKLAAVITAEMGKPIVEAEGEVQKCAWVCEYYADNAERFLADEPRDSAATESYVEFVPLGVVLAVMPWNFPFWQVLRFAAPALMAGNAGILKHASNVPQCALAIEEIFRAAGVPEGVFSTVLISGPETAALIADERVAAVTLTGSEAAGASVGEAAGRAIKKCVLELGGSDPFIVLDDADLAGAVTTGVRARYQNTGQSCIAAKRFVVTDKVFNEFRERYVEEVGRLKIGDPAERSTQIGPLARDDLRDDLERQVRRSVDRGARVLVGGERRPGRGYFFEPTVVEGVSAGMPLAREEVFGPVAALIRVRDAEAAVQIANDSPYGLGASLWTADLGLARALARRIAAGQVFVNGMVSSDPRLPFGGIKRSGYGRELSDYGIREFVNIQTVWLGPKKE